MRKILAKHHVVELEGVSPRLSDDPGVVGRALRRLCADAVLHVVNRVRHEFTPHGLTVLFVLRESHLAYSSWPERRYAILDLFLCSAPTGLAQALSGFARAVGAKRVRVRRFPVGPVSGR